MIYLVICGAALFVSGLTLYSGFGLGTLLVLVFAMFELIPLLRNLRIDRPFC